MSVLQAMLRAGVPASIAHAEAPRAEKAMIERDITTQARARDFLAQVLHESVGLRYFEEIASGREYEGRRDLGNTQPGDGPRFKGRGPIQLTGRANYRFYGAKLGLPLESHPELAARHDVGWRIAALYWQDHGLNQLADAGAFLTITKRINGGTNGWASRVRYRQLVGAVDCRPVQADPYAHLNRGERRRAREFDSLHERARRGDHVARARRAKLKREMTTLRKRIWLAAQPRARGGDGRGWGVWHRRVRYAALMARTKG